MQGLAIGTSAHSAHDLVADHENTIPIADLADFDDVTGSCRDARQRRSNDRFEKECRYSFRTHRFDGIDQLLNESISVFLLRSCLMTVGITWRDLVDIVLFEEGLKERTTGGMSTNAQCTKGRPV